MSDAIPHRPLPALVVHPERKDRPESWLDRLETAVTSWPVALRSHFGDPRTRTLIAAVGALDKRYRALQDADFVDCAEALRVQLRRDGFRLPVVADSFALVREAARRSIGLRHHDVQLAGGFAILNGAVAEMETGEGKTLTATLAVATAALAGIPVHVVTVNDYLARRDAAEMAPVYRMLGLTVGTIVHGLPPHQRREAYNSDVTYASNKEIAFDYLRDRILLGERPSNLRVKLRGIQHNERQAACVIRGLHFAIVDEADSVLVDEARTPLIISRETRPDQEERWARTALGLARELEPETDFKPIQSERRIELTKDGRERLAVLGEELGGIWRSTVRREEAARQALMALNLFERGDHYLVRDGKVEIVDEYTGRIMADRSWSEGLHQLIELKEGCNVTGRKVPMARITYQRFFRRYQRLAGMTGTAREVTRELWKVYRLPVISIPTNRPGRRQRLPAKMFETADQKWQAIAERAQELAAAGHAVLIGTRSVAASEILSALLAEAGLDHQVLNAAQDEREAEIIAQAGSPGCITVATNMAGRGVDIPVADQLLDADGLHVILSEWHDARRIDRQLEGRCARQGEPGVTEAYLSLEDPLLQLAPEFLVERVRRLPQPWRNLAGLRLLRSCQRRAERAHSRARHALLQQDRRLGTLLAFTGALE